MLEQIHALCGFSWLLLLFSIVCISVCWMLSTFYHETFELELLYLNVGRITVFYARVMSIGDNGARVNTVAIFSHFSCSVASYAALFPISGVIWTYI